MQQVFRDHDPHSGSSTSREPASNFLKAIAWDGIGFVLVAKKLERGASSSRRLRRRRSCRRRHFGFCSTGFPLASNVSSDIKRPWSAKPSSRRVEKS
ncbi:MAG: hypothetical protein KIT80_23920 [Chitinophagaceae bacterium]|nr:hypothetical protein [Chitinophagaceae bacterium]